VERDGHDLAPPLPARRGDCHPASKGAALPGAADPGARRTAPRDLAGRAAQTLDALRDDPTLVSARAMPLLIPSVAPQMALEAQAYRFKVSYRRADDVWFIIETSFKHTLDDLHAAIIDAADFDDDHRHAFYLSGRAWDKRTEYGHEDARHSSGMQIGKLRLRLKQRFLYLFDFGDQHEFDVQLIETSPEPPCEQYPRIVAQHGNMPPQYPNWDGESEVAGDEVEEDKFDAPNQLEAK